MYHLWVIFIRFLTSEILLHFLQRFPPGFDLVEFFRRDTFLDQIHCLRYFMLRDSTVIHLCTGTIHVPRITPMVKHLLHLFHLRNLHVRHTNDQLSNNFPVLFPHIIGITLQYVIHKHGQHIFLAILEKLIRRLIAASGIHNNDVYEFLCFRRAIIAIFVKTLLQAVPCITVFRFHQIIYFAIISSLFDVLI